VGNLPVVVLRNATLEKTESGRVSFNVSPKDVQLQQALQFLNDLMKPLQDPGGGLSYDFNSKGATVRLDLPLPDYQAGAFGIANLSLGFYFSALLDGEFLLRTGLSIAKADRPFTLTIFVLGGAGYLDLGIEYAPGSRKLKAALNAGIFASASLAIALGPVKGGVYAYFGLDIRYSANDGASDLQIAIVLMFAGHVCLLGFLSVSLSLRLDATYEQGGRLRGRGTLNYSIDLGPFWKVRVNQGVQYVYGNPGQEARLNPAEIGQRIEHYYGMFTN